MLAQARRYGCVMSITIPCHGQRPTGDSRPPQGTKAVSITPTAISSFSLVKPQAVGTAQGAGGKDVLASLFLRQFNNTTYITEADNVEFICSHNLN